MFLCHNPNHILADTNNHENIALIISNNYQQPIESTGTLQTWQTNCTEVGPFGRFLTIYPPQCPGSSSCITLFCLGSIVRGLIQFLTMGNHTIVVRRMLKCHCISSRLSKGVLSWRNHQLILYNNKKIIREIIQRTRNTVCTLSVITQLVKFFLLISFYQDSNQL